MPKGKPKYSGEFKQKVVEIMMREKLSYCETAQEYGITNHKSVARWERIYLEESRKGCILRDENEEVKGVRQRDCARR